MFKDAFLCVSLSGPVEPGECVQAVRGRGVGGRSEWNEP